MNTNIEPLRRYGQVWTHLSSVVATSYLCGHCGDQVSSEKGADLKDGRGSEPIGSIRICPRCWAPTFLWLSRYQLPGPLIEKLIGHVPPEVDAIYREALQCFSASAFTGAAMLCRKILMNVAVAEGAPERQSFEQYVDYLDENRIVSGKAKPWLTMIRSKGNAANHKIDVTSEDDAKLLIMFIGMLLRTVYEFPVTVEQAEGGSRK